MMSYNKLLNVKCKCSLLALEVLQQLLGSLLPTNNMSCLLLQFLKVPVDGARWTGVVAQQSTSTTNYKEKYETESDSIAAHDLI